MTKPNAVNVPKIIHLGYQDIEIKSWDAEGGLQGAYLPDRPQIRIADTVDGVELLNTMLHEIIHAAIYVYGIKGEFKDDDHEEKVVNVLGNALTEIFVRNPDLASWIKSRTS